MALRLSEGLGTAVGKLLSKDIVFEAPAVDDVLSAANISVAGEQVKSDCSGVADPGGKPYNL